MKFTESLRKREDFQNVYHKGRSKADRNFVLYIFENGNERNRLGVSVSKKVGNSVVRHRVKRLVKEAYRLHESEFQTGFDLVVIARNQVKDRTCGDVEKSICDLARRQGILVVDSAD